jgi:hypothetical protein
MLPMKRFALKSKWRIAKFRQWRHKEGEEYIDKGIYSMNIR